MVAKLILILLAGATVDTCAPKLLCLSFNARYRRFPLMVFAA
jgi:hypothetical protein